jgi:hypothetical protein
VCRRVAVASGIIAKLGERSGAKQRAYAWQALDGDGGGVLLKDG